jgi:hypothetical protein
MSSYHGTTEELMSTMGRRETSGHAEEWQRWDEDLVKDFGLWLGSLAKTFGLLLLGVLAALVIAWL